MIRWLDRAALAATLALPVFLMHGRAIAEILITAIDLCFLARCMLSRDWDWLRAPWVRIGGMFWAWLLVCSLPGVGAGGLPALAQAAAFVRVLLLPAALGYSVLRTATARLWLWRVLAAASFYIVAQTLLQLTTGRDLQGYRRNGDGELTGPFEHPRAAAPLSLLLFPLLLSPLSWLLARRRLLATLGGAALTVASVAAMVLIGQRMPLLLTLLGLLVSGLMLRRLRAIMAVAVVACAVLLAASAALSPPSFYRLVTKFSTQMTHFADSDYGLIAGRAVAIVAAHPLLGQGFDGFRDSCADPRYFQPLPWMQTHAADGGGVAACNIHPHNHYLEAATEAGLPGAALFAALVVAWWLALLRGIGRDPAPLRVALFVAAFIHEWPIASMGGFAATDLSGFFFVLLGWGLAEARPALSAPPREIERPRDVARWVDVEHVPAVP